MADSREKEFRAHLTKVLNAMLKKGRNLAKVQELEVSAAVLENEHVVMQPFLDIYPDWKPPVSHVAKILFAIDAGFQKQLSQAASNRAAIIWANDVAQWLCGLYSLLRRLRRRSSGAKSHILQSMKNQVILGTAADEDDGEPLPADEDDGEPLPLPLPLGKAADEDNGESETSEGVAESSSSSDSDSLECKEIEKGEDHAVLKEWYLVHLRAECEGCEVCHKAAEMPWASECQRQVAEEQHAQESEGDAGEPIPDDVLREWYIAHLRADCAGCEVCHEASSRPWAEECKKQVDAGCYEECHLEEDLEVHS